MLGFGSSQSVTQPCSGACDLPAPELLKTSAPSWSSCKDWQHNFHFRCSLRLSVSVPLLPHQVTGSSHGDCLLFRQHVPLLTLTADQPTSPMAHAARLCKSAVCVMLSIRTYRSRSLPLLACCLCWGFPLCSSLHLLLAGCHLMHILERGGVDLPEAQLLHAACKGSQLCGSGQRAAQVQ